MGRKAQVKRSPEEKWEILQEGLRSGNISETCRKLRICGIAGKMKRNRERRQRLGGEALRAVWMKRKPSASSNWNGRWAASNWRSRY